MAEALGSKCLAIVYSTTIPEEFRGYKRTEIIKKLYEMGWDEECIRIAIKNWFGVKDPSAYLRAIRRRLCSKGLLSPEICGQIEGQTEEERKEEEAEEKKEEEEGIPEPLKLEEEEEEKEVEKEEIGIGIEISDEDIINLYGAVWDIASSLTSIPREELIPDERIRRTGKYLAGVLRKLGLLNAEVFMYASVALLIGSDISYAFMKVKQYKKQQQLKMKKEEGEKREEKKAKPSSEVKNRLKGAWKRAGA